MNSVCQLGRKNGFAALILCVSLLGGCNTTNTRTVRHRAHDDVPTQAESLSEREVADVQMVFARTLERDGDLPQAMAAYQKIIGRDPKRADAYHRLAVVCGRLGKFDKSADFFRKALKLEPGDPDIFCDLGYSLYTQKRWAEAEMNLKQAIELQTDHSRAHNNLGLLLAQNKHYEEALAAFRKAGCTPAATHMNLAYVLTMNQEWGAARDEYQRALAADPSSDQARRRLKELNTLVTKLKSQSQPDAADSISLAAGEAEPQPRTLSDVRAVSDTAGEPEEPTKQVANPENDTLKDVKDVSQTGRQPVGERGRIISVRSRLAGTGDEEQESPPFERAQQTGRLSDGPAETSDETDRSPESAGLLGAESLYLSGSEITDAGLNHLHGLKKLKHLYVSDTQITDQGLSHLSRLTLLESLWLSHCRITDAGLVPLRQLHNLNELLLDGTDITDAGLVHLRQLTNLKTVDVRETHVTEAGVQSLKQALPGVTVRH